MGALTRVVALAAAGLATAVALPAMAQTPCDNADSINCDYHPDYGWIIRGSAPSRENVSPSQLDKDLKEWREKMKDPEFRRELQRREEEKRAQQKFDREIKRAEDIVRRSSWTGTCPPEWTDRARGDPKLSYELTRRACYNGDMYRCDALQTVCKGDSMEPYEGHCRFGVGVTSYEVQNTQWTDQVILENRAMLQKACTTDRQAWACSSLARDYTFMRAPFKEPNRAFAYVQRACQIEGPQSMDCLVLRDGCIPGGPPVSTPAPPAQPAAQAPPPMASLPAPSPTAPPKAKPTDPRWLNEKTPRPCTFAWATKAWREKTNAPPAAERAEMLRDAEARCLATNGSFACIEAASSHALMDIPEAKPEKAWELLSRACQFDSLACDARTNSCP